MPPGAEQDFAELLNEKMFADLKVDPVLSTIYISVSFTGDEANGVGEKFMKDILYRRHLLRFVERVEKAMKRSLSFRWIVQDGRTASFFQLQGVQYSLQIPE